MSEASYMMESEMADIAIIDDKNKNKDDYFIKLTRMKKQYDDNRMSDVGCTIQCACLCGRKFIKKNYQSQFYRNKGAGNCKDKYWNNVSDKRRKRAQEQKK